MLRLAAALVVSAFLGLPSLSAQAASTTPVFIAIYWKARSGMETDYEKYIREVAGPIDDEAQRAGAFEELRTYVPEQANGEWTHLRVFRLKDQAQLDAFSARMDEAGKKLYPDASKRPKSDHLRDMVRREIWRGFH